MKPEIGSWTKVHPSRTFFFFFLGSLLLSSSTRRRFYPQRSSGQAVVTGVIQFPPRHVASFSIVHRVQHSHCSSIFIECCYLTLSRFPLINFYARKSPNKYVHSVRSEPTKLILAGTRITYYSQATGDEYFGLRKRDQNNRSVCAAPSTAPSNSLDCCSDSNTNAHSRLITIALFVICTRCITYEYS